MNIRPVFVVLAVCSLAGCAPEPARRRPRQPDTRTLTVWATAYCIDGTTKSGARTRPGVIAADPDVLPLGTVVRIEDGARRGTYTVLDTGPAVNGREIDIFIPDCRAAKAFGRQKLRLRVLRRDPARR